MRIYSKFKDHYDNIGYYNENDRVWQRKPRCIDIEDVDQYLVKAWNRLPTISRTYSNNTADYVMLLGLCGIIYPIIVSHNPNGTIYKSYSYSYYMKHLANKSTGRGNWWTPEFDYSLKGFDSWFNQHNNKKILDPIFIDFNSPLFMILPSDRELIVNPQLNLYKMCRIFPPVSMYQKIDTYLGNELAQIEQCGNILTDELKRDSKGFDEWSFKQKGPKKRKRRKYE